MDAITKSGNVFTHFIMIKYTVDHQYTNSHANIRKYNKVITILSFQWRRICPSSFRHGQLLENSGRTC